MAEIYIKDLIKIIKEDPKYLNEWEKGVPADQALYIKFHDKKVTGLSSEVFSVENGNELVIDLDKEGI